jgi:hypothetical protein
MTPQELLELRSRAGFDDEALDRLHKHEVAEAVAQERRRVEAMYADMRRIDGEIFEKQVGDAFDMGRSAGANEERESCALVAVGWIDGTVLSGTEEFVALVVEGQDRAKVGISQAIRSRGTP